MREKRNSERKKESEGGKRGEREIQISRENREEIQQTPTNVDERGFYIFFSCVYVYVCAFTSSPDQRVENPPDLQPDRQATVS